MIQSEGGNGRRYVLVDAESQPPRPIAAGDVRKSFRGVQMVVTGGRAPQHEGSTGHVHCTPLGGSGQTQAYYPSVLNLKWMLLP